MEPVLTFINRTLVLIKRRFAFFTLYFDGPNMRNLKDIILHILFPVLLLFAATSLWAQNEINNDVVSFKKSETTTGIVFDINREREELLSDESRFEEERTLFNGKFRFENRRWNLLDYKQERLYLNFELGPYGGFGDIEDSTKLGNKVSDQNFYGMRTSASVDYLHRYYYDAKSYAVFNVNAWGRHDWYKQDLEGTSADSLGMVTAIDERDTHDRFRYGIRAKAGWGYGRLSPMNHLMKAHYLLEKYYPGRIFSDYEIAQLAQVIAGLKHGRDHKTGHIPEKEMTELAGFIRNKLILASPESMAGDWQFGEFDPRYEGSRIETGPHFSYYNQEPDFVYGAYFQYDKAKYVDVHWNRNLVVSVMYKRYTKQGLEINGNTLDNNNTNRDWATADVNMGWSYYPDLKSQFDFGVRYAPGIELNNFNDIGHLSHNIIPYVGYFTQLTAKSRLKLDFAWRITDGEQFVLPGPEFSLAIYKSKY